MPYKRGAGGHLQRYSSINGRYCRFYPIVSKQPQLTKKEEAQRRRENIVEALRNRAKKSKDPHLFEAFETINERFPNQILHVNEIRKDPLTGKNRELDLICQNFVIEIKSGTGKHCLKQFLEQKAFSEAIRKTHIVYGPEMSKARISEYTRHGIIISQNLDDLITIMKERKK